MIKTYLGLAAAATVGVNPDVLRLNLTALVKVHVFHELLPKAFSQYGKSFDRHAISFEMTYGYSRGTHILRVGDGCCFSSLWI